MVKFSCFSHIQSHKNKRTLAPLLKEFQQKTSEDCGQNKSPMLFHLEDKHDHSEMPEINAIVSIPCSTIRGCKSEEMNRISDRDSRSDTHEGFLKKSHSLGSELDQEGITSCKYNEDLLDEVYLDAHSSEDSGSVEEIKGPQEVILNSRKKPAFISEVIHVETHITDSIISATDTENNEDRSQTSLSVCGGASKLDSCDPSTLVKSCSMPNIAVTAKTSSNYQFFHTNSSENISLVGITEGDNAVQLSLQVTRGKEILDVYNNNKGICTESAIEEGFKHCGQVDPVNNWEIQELHDVNSSQNYKGESSGVPSALLPNNEFKKKRIKDWIMGLQNFSPSEQIDQYSQNDDDYSLDGNVMSNVSLARNDSGMDAVKKYISCLSATATTSHLSNSGLVLIPFMSTFSSLKVLNLSGNAIVRITSGALPHGLHVLNLSKNNISMIEGLRELKRLRILDLSYNRIFRIGHGLASCSSMKELYLAGNKISEVEGLHRLLKLNVLDLRFNKISTSRCLGQLAANYISLQALSLDGNPAQKNIGDDQIRKQLHDLLPHLVYYNRHPIKATSLKDTVADRSTRTGSVSYQFDRAHRSEKLSRKKTHGFAAQKSLPVSTHGHKIQASNNVSRVRQRHLHHNGTLRVTAKHMNTQNFEFCSRTPRFETDLLMRRSQSEGTIGTL